MQKSDISVFFGSQSQHSMENVKKFVVDFDTSVVFYFSEKNYLFGKRKEEVMSLKNFCKFGCSFHFFIFKIEKVRK